MRNPCLTCDRKEESKNDPECVNCDKRIIYINYVTNGQDSLPDCMEDIHAHTSSPDQKSTEQNTYDTNLVKDASASDKDKKCVCCGEIKLIDDFYQAISCKDGYTNQCKKCIRRKKTDRRLERKKDLINPKKIKSKSIISRTDAMLNASNKSDSDPDQIVINLVFQSTEDRKLLQDIKKISLQNRRTIDQHILWMLEKLIINRSAACSE